MKRFWCAMFHRLRKQDTNPKKGLHFGTHYFCEKCGLMWLSNLEQS